MADIDMYLPKRAVTMARSEHPDSEVRFFQRTYGCKTVEDNDHLVELVANGSIKSIMLPTPEAYSECKSYFPDLPMILRCSEGLEDRIQQCLSLDADYYLCKNKKLAAIIGDKAIALPPLVAVGCKPAPASERKMYCGYIHKISEFWPIASEKFSALKQALPSLGIKVFGRNNPDGITSDAMMMPTSRATIHLRDRGMTDYAVVKSIAMGIPVITDVDTIRDGYLEDVVIHGRTGLIANSQEELAAHVMACENDEFLDQLSSSACEFAQGMAPEQESLWKFRRAVGDTRPTKISFVVQCMGRLETIKKTLPTIVSQPNSECVFVDYSCPDESGKWVEENCPEVKVVRVPGQSRFNLPKARNAGAAQASGDAFCFVDADIRLEGYLSEYLLKNMLPRQALVVHNAPRSTTGMIACYSKDFFAVEGYDENFEGWGCDDLDLRHRIEASGAKLGTFPTKFVTHLEHCDFERVRYLPYDKAVSIAINSRYLDEKKRMINRGQAMKKEVLSATFEAIKANVLTRLSIAAAARPLVMGSLSPRSEWVVLARPPQESELALSKLLSREEGGIYANTLTKLLGLDTLLVYDGNPGLGGSTRLIAERAPCAVIVSVQSWEPDDFDRFLANTWDYRDRVFPVPEGAPVGVIPDLVKHEGYSPEESMALLTAYPSATHVGPRWPSEYHSSAFASEARVIGTYEDVSKCCWLWNKKHYFR